MQISVSQYVGYIEKTAEIIGGQGDYITALDSATGDGDHWLNINIGYQKIVEKSDEFKSETDFKELFKKLAKRMMSEMGGTSGALYGSMYLSAAKEIETGIQVLDSAKLARILTVWAEAVMSRGDTKPGQKTMVDALYPAARKFTEAIEAGKDERTALTEMGLAAQQGAEHTKAMEAVRGRASNQPGKGVGHLDPGAVTMALQLQCLADYLAKNCL